MPDPVSPRAPGWGGRVGYRRVRVPLLIGSLILVNVLVTAQVYGPFNSSTETIVPTQYPDVVNILPSVSLGPNGTSIWLVWESLPPITVSNVPRVLLKQTLPGFPALTWSNDMNVTAHPGLYADEAPAITRLANNTMMVAWSRMVPANGTSLGIWYRLNTRGIWSSEVRLTFPGVGRDESPSLFTDQKGSVWVIWDRQNPESVVYDTNADGVYGASLKYDPKIRFVNATTSPMEAWSPGKTVVYDSDANGIFDAGEPVIAPYAPAVGTKLKNDPLVKFVDPDGNNVWDPGESVVYDSFIKFDPKVKFVDANGNNVWDPGETVVYDSNSTGIYNPGKPVINGTAPVAGTPLKVDPKVKFFDAGHNNTWAPGDAVVYDADGDNLKDPGEPVIAGTPTGDGVYDAAEPVIAGGTPVTIEPLIAGAFVIPGTALTVDSKIMFVNATNSPAETWSSGKAVVYDTDGNGKYDSGEPVIAGTVPAVGTKLKNDPKLKFVDANNNKVWDKRANITDLYYKISNGNSWSTDQQLTNDPNFNFQPSGTQAHDGRVWVVWQSNRINKQFDIFYKVFNGTGWTPDTLLFSDASTSCQPLHAVGCDDLDPDIIQDRNGAIQIFWSRSLPSTLGCCPTEIVALNSTNNGLSFAGNYTRVTFNNISGCAPSACTLQSQLNDNSPAVVEFNQRLWLFWYRPSPSVPDEFNLIYISSDPVFTHDVAIVSATAPSASSWNTTVQVTMVVANYGDFNETANVTLMFGPITVGKVTISLAVSAPPATITFTVKYNNATKIPPGRYPVTASITIPQEPLGNLANNNRAAGKLALFPPGDMDQNGDVTLVDAVIWIQYLGSTPGSTSPPWNPIADLDGDGVVDMRDAVILSQWLGTRI